MSIIKTVKAPYPDSCSKVKVERSLTPDEMVKIRLLYLANLVKDD